METIRTDRLELVPLNGPFIDALKRGDRSAAERQIGAGVSRWILNGLPHFVQLRLAQQAAQAAGLEMPGRAIVLVDRSGRRRVIGAIGFHGPPDERGRLEIGYAIDPAERHQGFAAEAMTALVEWATTRHGVTRFVISVPTPYAPSGRVPVEIDIGPAESSGELFDALNSLDEAGAPSKG